MQRFKNILMICNPEKSDSVAFDHISDLARTNNARLTIVEVHESATTPVAAYLEQRRAELDSMIDEDRFANIDVSTQVLLGRDFFEIIRLVVRYGYDLVAMTADSVHGWRSLAFGSTSMHLMRKCPCPVWVIQPRAEGQFKRIMAAVAPGLRESVDPINRKILEMASSLARREQGELHVVNAWDFTGKDRETSQSEMTVGLQARLQERCVEPYQMAVDSLLEQVDLTDLRYQVHLVQGQPANELSRFANDNDVDLIVMGTVTRGGVSGLLIGSTADILLRLVDCSVLTVKPDNFITPVT